MNALTKSLAVLSLLAGMALANSPASALPSAALPSPAPAQTALNTLLAQPNSPLPSGTKLLAIGVADGLATVNFSHELRDNFTGGDTAEMRAVNSILTTLGQFLSVSRVQILVEGHPIDSLGGLLVLSSPLPVIRPADATPQTGRRWLHRKTRPAPTPASGKKPLVHASA